MYDLYVPIVQNVEMKVPHDRAKEMIAEGLGGKVPQYSA